MSDPSNVSNDFNFNHILTNSISRVEILKGNQSSVYGSGAIAGAINITTKKGKQGITSDPDIWVNKDIRWWLGFTRANLSDWARLYGVNEFLGTTIKEIAKALVGAMGTPRFKDIWVRIHFLAYQEKAKHAGILLVGPEKMVLLTDGKQLVDLNLVVGYGQVFGATVNQARDVTIQLGL